MQSPEKDEALRAKTTVWQRSSFYLLGLGLVGLILGAYSLLGDGGSASASWGHIAPALIYGLVAIIVLLHVYWLHHDGLMDVMHREVVQQKIEAELNRELSLLDPTTEVYNRRYLRTILSKEASRARRYSQGLSVIMANVVGFRRVNDSLGHAGGDVFLREVAHLLQTSVRNSDYVVRFGGDVFLMILPDTAEDNAGILARRFEDRFGAWTQERGFAEFSLRLATGIAGYGENIPVEKMLSVAEERVQDRAAALKRGAGSVPGAAVAKTHRA